MAALAVIDGGNNPPKKTGRPRSVATAARSGDKVAMLTALRDRIAKIIQDKDCPPRDVSSLTRRLIEVCGELEKAEAAAGKKAERTRVADDEAWDGI